jgi:hypothetical protein
MVLSVAVLLALAGSARAHRDAASEASALSMLPIAVSVVAPAGLIVSGAAFTVVAISAVAEGTVWVLERASDGARLSVTMSAVGVGAVSVGVGAAVETIVCSTGWVLSAAGKAIAFIPNEVGRALLYNERVTR